MQKNKFIMKYTDEMIYYICVPIHRAYQLGPSSIGYELVI